MREHNIQNIAHLSYYTNANGLLLVVLIKRGSAKFSLAQPAAQRLPIVQLEAEMGFMVDVQTISGAWYTFP